MAAAVKIFGRSISTAQLRRAGLFATGGLYLALDTGHPDLAIRPHFGDFTAGFSHQFSVGLSALAMSEVFGIPWDKMNPIRVTGELVLDYQAEIPTGGILQMEAKGVTRADGRSKARSSIYTKKTFQRSASVPSTLPTVGTQTAMVGVIIQAAVAGETSGSSSRRRADQGVIEVIDPEFGDNTVGVSKENMLASRYKHYAGVSMFAGLYDIAEELLARANALRSGKPRQQKLLDIRFNERETLQVGQRNMVGIQWRPSDQAQLSDDIWFYQAVDRNVIENILINDTFPQIRPYHHDQLASRNDNYVESLFSDGSYFGIGVTSRDALRSLSPRDVTVRDLHY